MKMCSSVWFSKGVATRRLFLRRTGISFLARSTQPFVVLGGSCRHDCNIWAMNLLICFLATISGSSAFSAMSSSTPPQIEYPRHIHPGGYSLPPLVEDRLSIITKSSSIDVDSADEIFQTDLLLIKPPDSKCAYLMCCFIFFFSLLITHILYLYTIHSGIIMGVVCIHKTFNRCRSIVGTCLADGIIII